jgi:hypothetical protein
MKVILETRRDCSVLFWFYSPTEDFLDVLTYDYLCESIVLTSSCFDKTIARTADQQILDYEFAVILINSRKL